MAHPLLKEVKYNSDGLITAVAQCVETDVVLMLAWINEDALMQTLVTGQVTYFSRSRQKLWQKGETSGHIQTLVSAHLDCDMDAILLKVKQTGPACHTGAQSCFFRDLT